MAILESREVELKYQVGDAAVTEWLRHTDQIAPGYSLQTLGIVLNTDTYYDTSDFALLRNGLTLRVRYSGGSPRVAIKGLRLMGGQGSEALHNRSEIEHEIVPMGEAPYPGAWPHEIASEIAELTGGYAEFVPIVTLVQQRLKRTVYCEPDAGSRVAELSIDDVTVQPGRHAEKAGAGAILPVVTRFQEVEIEASTGESLEHLHRLAEVLAAHGGLEPVESSKFARGLQAVSAHADGAPEGVLGILPEMPMAEACRLIWRVQLADLVLHEYGARMDADPEYVHAMRVAIRRARVAATVFRPYFRKGAIRPFLRHLKEWGRKLGAVRDLDVAIENVEESRKEMSRRKRKGLAAIGEEWQRRRRYALDELIEWLEGAAHREFLSTFYKFCHTAGLGVKEVSTREVEPIQVRHVMPGVILDRFAHVRAYETVFDQGQAVTPEMLHTLRIHCKFLRYCLEYTEHLLGEDGTLLIEQLKKLQNHLGKLNDAVTERQQLEGWRIDHADERDIEQRIASLEEVASELSAQFPEIFSTFIGPANRQTLARVIAHL